MPDKQQDTNQAQLWTDEEDQLLDQFFYILGAIYPEFNDFKKDIAEIESAEDYLDYCKRVIRRSHGLPDEVINVLLFAPLIDMDRDQILRAMLKLYPNNHRYALEVTNWAEWSRKALATNLKRNKNELSAAVNTVRTKPQTDLAHKRLNDLMPNVGRWFLGTTHGLNKTIKVRPEWRLPAPGRRGAPPIVPPPAEEQFEEHRITPSDKRHTDAGDVNKSKKEQAQTILDSVAPKRLPDVVPFDHSPIIPGLKVFGPYQAARVTQRVMPRVPRRIMPGLAGGLLGAPIMSYLMPSS